MDKHKRMTELKEQVNKVYQEFREAKPKSGKDIKTFADLPEYVQQILDAMSTFNGKINKATKTRRTSLAIHYQQTHADSTGVAI